MTKTMTLQHIITHLLETTSETTKQLNAKIKAQSYCAKSTRIIILRGYGAFKKVEGREINIFMKSRHNRQRQSPVAIVLAGAIWGSM